MMIYNEGDKSKAICPFEKKAVEITFQVRDVPLRSSKVMVPNVLAGVCDSCGKVIAIPPQSSPRIRETIETPKNSLETRLPVQLVDILNLSCEAIAKHSANPKKLQSPLLAYYVRAFRENPKIFNAGKLLESKLAKGKAIERFSLKVSEPVHRDVAYLARQWNCSVTDVVKTVILQAKADILDKKAPKRIQYFESLVSFVVA